MAKAVLVIPDTPVQRLVGKPAPLMPPNLSLHQQNWVWAQQFKEAVPDVRDTATVKPDGSLKDDFVPAMRRAATLAGNGGQVILFTGHGCRAACTGRSCSFNAAPTKFGFETVPETTATKTKRIDEDVFDFLTVAQRSGSGWAPRPFRKPGDVAATTLGQGVIDAMAAKWEALDAMKTAFTANKIDRLILLTCNVGTFGAQCQRFANLIGTTVVAYRAKIAATEYDPPFGDGPGRFIRPVQVWCTAPPHTEAAPFADPFITALLGAKTPAMEAFLRANWRKHPYFAQLPLGPVVECRPGGQPTNWP